MSKVYISRISVFTPFILMYLTRQKYQIPHTGNYKDCTAHLCEMLFNLNTLMINKVNALIGPDSIALKINFSGAVITITHFP
jgi:hypothetical protein